jgi:hypothetical protein
LGSSQEAAIGEFAALTGLTARALRLYADARVLTTFDVDAGSGYRSYGRTQLERAERVRLLRASGVAVADLSFSTPNQTRQRPRSMCTFRPSS